MRWARSSARTPVDRAARELRGCGNQFAFWFKGTTPAGRSDDRHLISPEGGWIERPLPEGHVWAYGTLRVCIRPFGHDGSDHRGWSLERVTDLRGHVGPRVGFCRAMKASDLAEYLRLQERTGKRLYAL